MPRTAETYDVRPDAKGRVILRGARSPYYSVTKKDDGSFVIRPRKLVEDDAAQEGGRSPHGALRPRTKISGRLAVVQTILSEEIDRIVGLPNHPKRQKAVQEALRRAIAKLEKGRKAKAGKATGEDTISARTLAGMDKAMENLKAGKRSAPADLKKYAKYAQ